MDFGISQNPTFPSSASSLASGLSASSSGVSNPATTPSAYANSIAYGGTPKGTVFPASDTTTKTVTGAAPTASPITPHPSNPTVTLPNGATARIDGAGNVTNFQPAFSINSTATPPSSALAGNQPSPADTRQKYQDAVTALSQAQGYSPDYISALQGVQSAQTQGATLKSNFYTGNNLPGDTLGYAQGFTTREQALNDIRQLGAQQGLDVQTLLRQGNIESAKALTDAYKPETVSPGSSLVSPLGGSPIFGGTQGYTDVQAQQTYFNLQQQFPDAQIPAYDTSATPQQNLQNAQAAAAKSPSFQSRNLVQVALPGGGISFMNKNQIVTKPDGTMTVISAAQGAQADAYKKTISDNQSSLSQTQAALDTADKNFPLLLDAAKAAGVNNSAPLVNQFSRKLGASWSTSPAFASLQTLIPSLQSEYSRIIARGGTVDDNTRNSAQAIINGNYSLEQLQSVYNTVKNEGKNVIGGYQSAIDDATKGLNGIYNSPAVPGQTGGSSANPFSSANFFGQ